MGKPVKMDSRPTRGENLCEVCDFQLEPVPGKVTVCGNCGHRDYSQTRRSSRLSLAFTLTALIFYIPANLFPFMSIELYGNRNSSTIWSGTISLAEDGSYGIALIVFLASILIPAVKLIILIYLSMTGANGQRQKLKMRLYHFVEAIGRWSMLDIFLLAVLVAMVKLGHWTTVEPERGSIMFALVVIFTMLGSAYFDPKIIWENHEKAVEK